MITKTLLAFAVIASTVLAQSLDDKLSVWTQDTGATNVSMHWSGNSVDSVLVDGVASPDAKAGVLAITQAQVDAWKAVKDADSTEDAALGQEMTVALVQAIAARWPDEPPFTGEAAQVRQLTRRLIIESQAARLTLGDTNATVDARLDAVFSLRELDVISGYAAQLGIGKKR